MTPLPDIRAGDRRQVYSLLIVLAVGVAGGRILSAERLSEPSVHRAPGASNVPRPAWPATRPEPWPTFSSNDRSRWAVVRALVDEGTFVIGRRDRTVVLASGPAVLAARDPIAAAVLFQAGFLSRTGKQANTGIIFEDGWESVDKVLHPSRLEFYSTKPPLLSILAAGEYAFLNKAFGWSIVKQRWQVIRTIVFTFNVVPLAVYLMILAWLGERFADSAWARFYIVAAGGFATLVSPFLITFNNHTVAAASAAVALYATVRIMRGAGRWLFALAGFAAGFTGCNELPAASLAAGLGVYLFYKAPGRTLLFFLPAALVPVAALTANYLELGQLRPAYAEFGGPWYEYEGSHWRVPPGQTKRGIDFAGRNGETKVMYAFHLLLGHHGLFSLTPIMLLAVAGMLMQAWRLIHPLTPRPPLPLTGEGEQERDNGMAHSPQLRSPGEGGWGHEGPLLSLFTLLVSVVVVAFYIVQTDNYGGWSNGPRWLMWMTPLWLTAMLPALDWLHRTRAGRALALVLLALSIASMCYQQWNPWRHPWIYNWMESRGWIAY
jgi:hypothetical protein